MHSDSTYHGVVLLNYTVMAGTAGQKVDASSSARAPDDVIAIVLIPYALPPVLTKHGLPCEVKEDSRSGIDFAVSNYLSIHTQNIHFS
jgi:hypothetical protein